MMGEEDIPVPPEQAVDVEQQQEDNAEFISGYSTYAYVGAFISGVVLIISLTAGEGFEHHKYYGYGISVGAIAMFLSLVGYAMATMGPEQALSVVYINYVLFIWCFLGACIMTFGDGPFDITGNGYFGSWGLAVFSTMALGVNASFFYDTANTAGPIAGLFASSVVLLIAISSEGVKKSDEYYGEMVYSLIITIISILVTGGMLRGLEPLKAALLPIMAVFAILWITVACLLTFRGPFLNTGNGYFGAWGGALSSVFAVHAARQAVQQSMQS